MRTLLAAALAALAIGAVVPAEAASPTKTAKKALSTAKDAKRFSELTADKVDKKLAAQDVEIADNRRGVQEANGRFATLPDGPNANGTHGHEGSPVTIDPGQSGTATAACEPGEAVWSVTFELEYGGTAERPSVTSTHMEGDSASATAQNIDGTAGATLTATAHCAAR